MPAGIISDTLDELYQKLAALRCESNLDQDVLKRELAAMEDMTLDLLFFLHGLSCQPLIYTGKGSTEEVIKRLNWALTFTEDEDAAATFNAYLLNQKKQNAW